MATKLGNEATKLHPVEYVADETPEPPPKKPRKRKASQFVVFKTELLGRNGEPDETHETITRVCEGNSIKQCRERIEAEKIIGKLMICTVRQRLTTEVKEVLKFS